MRTDKNFILRTIVGENVLVPSGEAAQRINGMIHLTETGEFIWKLYDKKNNLEEIIQAVLEEFEVDEETARRDAYGFSKMLYQEKMLLDVPELENVSE